MNYLENIDFIIKNDYTKIKGKTIVYTSHLFYKKEKVTSARIKLYYFVF